MKGFVMINIEPGTEKSVYDTLTRLKGVKEVVPVYGEHDFIVLTDVAAVSDLNQIVLAVREISGVTNTRTILGMELKF